MGPRDVLEVNKLRFKSSRSLFITCIPGLIRELKHVADKERELFLFPKGGDKYERKKNTNRILASNSFRGFNNRVNPYELAEETAFLAAKKGATILYGLDSSRFDISIDKGINRSNGIGIAFTSSTVIDRIDNSDKINPCGIVVGGDRASLALVLSCDAVIGITWNTNVSELVEANAKQIPIIAFEGVGCWNRKSFQKGSWYGTFANRVSEVLTPDEAIESAFQEIEKKRQRLRA